MSWETVIGIEIHAHLQTVSKLFSSSSARYGAEPNRQACAVDLALPGTLPVINREALRMAVRFGLAVGAEIAPVCVFARKSYFYPDLPRGYQISQFEDPIVSGGAVVIDTDAGERAIALTRAHLEEDAGRLLHDGAGGSAVDLNRAGVPLLEIVTEPQLRSPEEAAACMRAIHELVVALHICDGNLEQGSLRCDANLSVRPEGQEELSTRVELKNINSFRFVERALRHERARQIEVLESGGTILQETRQYDPARDRTRPMRGKEQADDYRYFPDPDLLPVEVDERLRTEAQRDMPELPRARRARWTSRLGLTQQQAAVLGADGAWADYFEAVVAAGAEASEAARWISGDLFARSRRERRAASDLPISPEALALLLSRLHQRALSREAAQEVLDALWQGATDVDAVIGERGLAAQQGEGLEEILREVLEAHPQEVAQYRAGRTKLLGFFIGRVRERAGKAADPRDISEALRRALDSD